MVVQSASGDNVMESLLKDIRYGLRVLIKNPLFALTAVITLAFGIGAITAIFSVVNAVLIRDLPYNQPERIVFLWENFPRLDLQRSVISPLEFVNYKDQNHVFEEMGVYNYANINFTGSGEPERLKVGVVSASLFQVLGVDAYRGRTFVEEENQEGRDGVAVLSYDLWQRRFGSDQTIIGKDLTLDGQSATVVGVMPPGFRFPGEVELWMPITFAAQELTEANRGVRYLRAMGRLKPGISLPQAKADIDTLAGHLMQQDPDTYPSNGYSVDLVPMREQILGDTGWGLKIMLIAACFVLLIACSNVANLLLARGATRQKEIALRTALGATRTRVFRQLLTESVLLSVIASILGTLIAVWVVNALVAFNPESIPRLKEVSIDGSVLGFALLVSLLTGICFGLVPALRFSKPDVNEMLKEGGRSSGGATRHRLHRLLVVSEIALSLVLLIAAALMIKSVGNLLNIDPGFGRDNILTTQLSLPQSRYSETGIIPFYQQLISRIEAMPGVKAAGAVNRLPIGSGGMDRVFLVEGHNPTDPNDTSNEQWRAVTPNYFTALSIALRKGRHFTDQDRDGAPEVTIVNESFASRYWPDQDPLGKRIKMTGDNRPWITVVGVIGDIKHFALDQNAKPEMYFPYLQKPWPGLIPSVRTMTVVVHTATDPLAMANSLRREVWSVDPNLPIYNIKTMDTVLAESIKEQRFNMLLLSVIAGIALILASVGIYGVMAYSVSQRTHEIGIRMALGAQSGDILKMVVRQGAVLAVIGVAIGLIAALALTRFMSSMLFGVSTTDMVIFIALSAALALVALVASVVPARKAAKVDPMIALRHG